MRVPTAFVEPDGDGRWKPLSKAPLAPVGFADESALLDSAHSASPFRLLMEYFAFPAKFDFVDIDVARIARATGTGRRISLHLPVVDLAMDSSHAHVLDTLSASNLRLFCPPIVNLFSQDAMPISLRDAATAHRVTSRALKSNGIEVRSIDAVRIAREGEQGENLDVTPYRSLLHGRRGRDEQVYRIAERDPCADGAQSTSPTSLRLIDADGAPVKPRGAQLNVELNGTNGGDPQTLPIGDPEGDLLNEKDNLPGQITILRRPAQPRRLPRDHGALWRLIAAMTPHALPQQPSGLGALTSLLVQYAARASSAVPPIDGIVKLDHKAAVRWMAVKPMPTFVRGIKVALTLNEAAFVMSSLKVFIDVMDSFVAPHAPRGGFIQLVVHSRDTGENCIDARRAAGSRSSCSFARRSARRAKLHDFVKAHRRMPPFAACVQCEDPMDAALRDRLNRRRRVSEGSSREPRSVRPVRTAPFPSIAAHVAPYAARTRTRFHGLWFFRVNP